MKLVSKYKKICMVLCYVFLIIILISKIDVKMVVETIHDNGKYAIIFSVILNNMSILLSAFKWKLLLGGVKIIKLIEICLKAQFYSIVLPGQLFGEGAKVIYLSNGEQSLENATTSVIFDKITSLAGMILLGGLGLLITETEVSLNISKWIVIMMLLFILMLIILSNRQMYNIIYHYISEKRNIKIIPIILKYLESWGGYIDNKGRIIQSVLLGICNHLLVSLQLSINISFLGYEFHIGDACWVSVIISIMQLLPISLGGLGVREVSLVGMLSLFNIPTEVAVATSFINYFSSIPGAFIGGILCLFEKRNIGRKKSNE